MRANGEGGEGVVSNNGDQHFLNICIGSFAFKTSVHIRDTIRSH